MVLKCMVLIVNNGATNSDGEALAFWEPILESSAVASSSSVVVVVAADAVDAADADVVASSSGGYHRHTGAYVP